MRVFAVMFFAIKLIYIGYKLYTRKMFMLLLLFFSDTDIEFLYYYLSNIFLWRIFILAQVISTS